MSEENIRNAQVSELGDILSLKEQCFSLSMRKLQSNSSLRNNKEFFQPEDTFVFGPPGEIDSMVELTNMRYFSNGSTINIGGIGSVATSQNARGKGRMSSLLKFASKEMKKRNIPLSILWGATSRYRNFGWEMAGNNVIFTITPKSIARVNPDRPLLVEPYRKEKHLGLISSLHKQTPFRVERTPQQYEFLLNRTGNMVWVGDFMNKKGYLVLSGESVIEFGGNQEVILNMLAYLFQNIGYPQLKLYCPQTSSFVLQELYPVSTIWHGEPLGMLKIISLFDLLKCFKPQLQTNLHRNPQFKGENICLSIGDEQFATISFGEEIKISPREESTKKIILSDLEMVRFLFPFGQSCTEGLTGEFAPLFKLPFFWSQLDMV